MARKNIQFKDLTEDDLKIISSTSKLRTLGASENLLIFLLEQFAEKEAREAEQTAYNVTMKAVLTFFGADSPEAILQMLKRHSDEQFPAYSELMHETRELMTDADSKTWTELKKNFTELLSADTKYEIRQTVDCLSSKDIRDMVSRVTKVTQEHRRLLDNLHKMDVKAEYFET
jgi:hypothetical protein